MQKKGTVLWTGGKDSALAFYKANQLGIDIINLATFAPENANFHAHPLDFLTLQAQALNIPYYILKINEPYNISYEYQLKYLKEKTGISIVVTGDISEVDKQPNWITERCKTIKCETVLPLWHSNRLELLETLLKNKFEIIFSCVKEPWLKKQWVGKKLNHQTIKELKSLNQENDVDLCGEQGEYHTLVLDAPYFTKRIRIQDYSVITEDTIHYLNLKEYSLQEK